MNPMFLGIDIAGKDNTWVAGISQNLGQLEVVYSPRLASLQEIVTFAEENDVMSAAIDAQLTMSLEDENGYRPSDIELREYLPDDCKNWVASLNSLKAVPIRGQFLANILSPIVGTIVETHPRADLLFGLGQTALSLIRNYKKGADAEKTVISLWKKWSTSFNIQHEEIRADDGALDALVCATVSYLYHNYPEKLYKLRNPGTGKRGRGPFYVIQP